MTRTVKINSIDTNKFALGDRKGKYTEIVYLDDDPTTGVCFQTCKMKIAFDPGERKSGGNIFAYSIPVTTEDVSGKKKENKASLKKLVDVVNALESLPEDTAGMVKYSAIYNKNPKYAPVVNFTVKTVDSIPKVSIFNTNGEILPFSALCRGAVCDFIVRPSHVWMSNGKYGVEFALQQVRVNTTSRPITSMSFIDDD